MIIGRHNYKVLGTPKNTKIRPNSFRLQRTVSASVSLKPVVIMCIIAN